MKYEEFVCLVQAEVKDTLGEEVQIELHHVRKNNNVELDGLAIRHVNSNVAPTIYLNGFYEEYRRGRSISEIVKSVCGIYEKSRVADEVELKDYTDYEIIKDSLACKLINRERNRDFLQSVPYLPFLNLAIVAYYKVDHPLMGSGAILVNNAHLDSWLVSPEELFYQARRNMKKILPERFENIAKILTKDPDYEVPEEDIPMYVLTNSECFYGAAYMIYDSILAEIGEILRDDYWIIPSSIHECIIMPWKSSLTPDEIAAMIYTVNCENVTEEEYLSDNLYCYQRDLHKLQIVETRIA